MFICDIAHIFTRLNNGGDICYNGVNIADLTPGDIFKFATLARLDLTEEEVIEFARELTEILHYEEQLQAIDVSGLEPTSQVTGLVNVTRADEILNYGYDPKELLKNVPEVEDGQIKVGRMIG